jgi:hypothetical protein
MPGTRQHKARHETPNHMMQCRGHRRLCHGRERPFRAPLPERRRAFAYVEARLWPNVPVCRHCSERERIGRLKCNSAGSDLYTSIGGQFARHFTVANAAKEYVRRRPTNTVEAQHRVYQYVLEAHLHRPKEFEDAFKKVVQQSQRPRSGGD